MTFFAFLPGSLQTDGLATPGEEEEEEAKKELWAFIQY